jgi:hypothetical protein
MNKVTPPPPQPPLRLISATLGIWLQLLGFFFQDFVISPKWRSSQKISLANCGCKLDMTVPPSPPPKKKNRLSIFGYSTYWNLSQNFGDLEEKFPSKSGECEVFFFFFFFSMKNLLCRSKLYISWWKFGEIRQ